MILFSAIVCGEDPDRVKLTIKAQDEAGKQHPARFYLVSKQNMFVLQGIFRQQKTIEVLPGQYSLVVCHGPERNFINKNVFVFKL